MSTTTITTTGAHGFMAGDKLTSTRSDFRWWKRLWHFVTFRKPPVIVEYFEIIGITDETSMTVGKI